MESISDVNDIDYAKIENAVSESLLLSEKSRPHSVTQQRISYDENGNKTVTTAVSEYAYPDIHALKDVLNERIGGPRDWC